MRRTFKWIILGGLIVGLAVIGLFLLFGERFLKLEPRKVEQRVDAVVVLAGAITDDPARMRAGTQLLLNGQSRLLILPLRHETFTWSWAVAQYGLHPFIPEDRILIGHADRAKDGVLLKKYGGTFIEASKTADFMRRFDLQSAIIVSSAYHMRRVKLAFKRFQIADGFAFFYHPVDTPARRSPWWMDSAYLVKVLHEYRKLLGAYWVYE